MKKVLISVLIVLLLVAAYFAIFRGVSAGNVKVLGLQQIKQENDNLEQEISQTEFLINNNFPSRMDELDQSIADLLKAKEEYLDLASISTESELKEAIREEEYTVEFLLTVLGRYATSKNVDLRYEILSGSTGEANVKNIRFTVSGDYVPIINFVSALEDDSELSFRIYNFKMVPGGQGLTATFLVTNVRVKQESVTGGGSSSGTNTPTTTDGSENSTTTNEGTTSNAAEPSNSELVVNTEEPAPAVAEPTEEGQANTEVE